MLRELERSQVNTKNKLRLALGALGLLLPGCAVGFQDWPDPGRARAGATSTAESSSSMGGARFSSPNRSSDWGAGQGNAVSLASAGSASWWSGGATAGGFGGAGATAVTRGGTTASTSHLGGTTAVTTVLSSGGTVLASGGTLHTTTQWLTLNGTQANAAVEPNAGLGIDGEFRVNTDSCTIIDSFDASTRCVSGTLCNYAYDNQYWGMALVFDFRSDGVQKWRWDPQAHGALGVAYTISGRTIPRLQLWVLDMDTSAWGEPCQASSCEIIGPPYGDDDVSGNGALYFDQLTHDNWAGTGIAYEHQAKNTLSLQFKVPAVIVGPVAFDFCIDRLGIITAK